MTDAAAPELSAFCPSCGQLEPGGDATAPCSSCGHEPQEAAFASGPCAGEAAGEACRAGVYHHGPTGRHFWTFASPPQSAPGVLLPDAHALA